MTLISLTHNFYKYLFQNILTSSDWFDRKIIAAFLFWVIKKNCWPIWIPTTGSVCSCIWISSWFASSFHVKLSFWCSSWPEQMVFSFETVLNEQKTFGEQLVTFTGSTLARILTVGTLNHIFIWTSTWPIVRN